MTNLEQCYEILKKQGLGDVKCVDAENAVQRLYSDHIDGFILEYLSPLSAFATFLVALITALWVYRQVRSTFDSSKEQINSDATIAAKRATLDFLNDNQTTEILAEQRREFVALRAKNDGFEQYALIPEIRRGESKKKKKKYRKHMRIRQLLLSVLNRYELIALGIHKGILDEDMYRDFFQDTFVNDFKSLQGFIQRLRKENSFASLFIEYQTLQRKWADGTKAGQAVN